MSVLLEHLLIGNFISFGFILCGLGIEVACLKYKLVKMFLHFVCVCLALSVHKLFNFKKSHLLKPGASSCVTEFSSEVVAYSVSLGMFAGSLLQLQVLN